MKKAEKKAKKLPTVYVVIRDDTRSTSYSADEEFDGQNWELDVGIGVGRNPQPHEFSIVHKVWAKSMGINPSRLVLLRMFEGGAE